MTRPWAIVNGYVIHVVSAYGLHSLQRNMHAAILATNPPIHILDTDYGFHANKAPSLGHVVICAHPYARIISAHSHHTTFGAPADLRHFVRWATTSTCAAVVPVHKKLQIHNVDAITVWDNDTARVENITGLCGYVPTCIPELPDDVKQYVQAMYEHDFQLFNFPT